MGISEAVLRFVLGGAVVLAVSLVAKYGDGSLAGIVALFPAISFIGYYFMSKAADVATVRSAMLASLCALPLVALFVVVSWFALGRGMSVLMSLLCGVLAWLVGAYIYVKFIV